MTNVYQVDTTDLDCSSNTISTIDFWKNGGIIKILKWLKEQN